MSEPLVDLIVEDPAWDDAVPDLEAVADAAATMALGAVKLDAKRHMLALLACDDGRIAALNTTFRDRTGPTNVLSWPAFELAPTAPGAAPPAPPEAPEDGRLPLGDVAIALQTCRREAENASIPLKNHVTHLILHACLHPLGYDHETAEDAALMEGIESRAMLEAGFPDPYAG